MTASDIWQPIHTAPHDGSMFLAYNVNQNGLPQLVCFDAKRNDFVFTSTGRPNPGGFTHWQPKQTP